MKPKPKKPAPASFTQGPWTVSKDFHNELEVLNVRAKLTGSLVAEIPHMDARDEQNASLISAAPDLLAALKVIEARIMGRFDDPSLMKMGPLQESATADVLAWAKAAILKAAGGK